MVTLTSAHVVISLAGILSGLVVVRGFIQSRRLNNWTAVFLATTVATSATGFLFFPLQPFLPSHVVGIVSLAVLAVAIAARYAFRLVGVWRLTYVVSALMALYLNLFVLVVQAFRRVPSLRDLAPTQTETPFVAAQLALLVIMVALGIQAAGRFERAQQRPPITA